MTMMQISAFLALAEQGSFSRAAESLYISQSSVSKLLKSLEQELNRQLIVRSNNGCTLTAFGETVLDEFRSIHTGYTSIQQAAISKEKGTGLQTLRLAIMPILASYKFQLIMEDFQKQQPSIRFSLNEASSSTVINFLVRNQCDFALIRGKAPEPSLFESLVIGTDELACIVNVNHPYAVKPFITLTDLRDQPLILADLDGDLRSRISMACLKESFSPRIEHLVTHMDTAEALVRAGLGIEILFSREAEQQADQQLRLIPIVPAMSSQVVLLWLKSRNAGETKKDFIDFVQKAMKKALEI